MLKKNYFTAKNTKLLDNKKIYNSECLEQSRHILILLLMSIFLFSLIFLFGNIMSNDMLYHLNIIRSLNLAWKNGTFTNRIIDLVGQDYGYGTGLFYSLMPAGICVIFMNIFNIQASTALALEYSLIFFLSSISVYFFIKRISENIKTAFLCSIFYLLFPYFIINVYIRFAFSEIFLMLSMPLIARSIYELLSKNDKKDFLFFFVLGYSLAIINHLTTTIFLTIILFIYLCLNLKKFFYNKNWLVFLVASAIVLMISAYFYIPMLVNFGGVETLNLASSGTNLWETSIYKLPSDFHLFLCFLFVFLVYIFFLITYFVQKKPKKLKHLLIISTICLWMLTPLFPWTLFGFVPFSLIQFSWRLYNLNAITTTIMLAVIIKYFNYKYIINIFKFCIAGIGLFCLSFCLIFSSAFSLLNIDSLTSTDSGLNYNQGTGAGKFGDYYPTGLTFSYLSTRDVEKLIYGSDMEVFEITNNEQICQLSFVVDNPTDGYIILNIPYEVCENLEIFEVDKYSLIQFNITLSIEPYEVAGEYLIKINTIAYDDYNVKFIINYEENGDFDTYLKENPFEFVVKSGEASFSSFLKNSSSSYTVQIKTNETTMIELPTLFYKGYKITYTTQDGTYELTGKHGENGFIEIEVSESGTLSVEFEGTYVTVSNCISAFGIVAFVCTAVFMFVFENKRNKKSYHQIKIDTIS